MITVPIWFECDKCGTETDGDAHVWRNGIMDKIELPKGWRYSETDGGYTIFCEKHPVKEKSR